MADEKFYLWAPMTQGVDKDGAPKPNLAAGTEVSKVKLGVSDEQWEDYVAAGSVRATKYPNMPPEYQGSPIDFLRQKVSEAEEASLAASLEAADAALAAEQEVAQVVS